jgi:hypothetical protein
MSLLFPNRPQFKSPMPPIPSDPAPENDTAPGPAALSSGLDQGVVSQLRNWQCRLGDYLGWDICFCCSRWHRKSRMDGDYCTKCAAYLWLQRLIAKGVLP